MKTIQEALSDYWCEHVAEMDELHDAVCQGNAHVLGTKTERIVYAIRGNPRHMIIWLGISVRTDGLLRHTETMRKLAADLGCKWFEFYTKRKGFIRVASRFGFERMPDEDDGVMKFRLMV